MPGFYVSDRVSLRTAQATLLHTSVPMVWVTEYPPRPGIPDLENLAQDIRAPKAPGHRAYYRGVRHHMGIHLTELALSVFPIVGEQFLAMRPLQDALNSPIVGGHHHHDENAERANDRRKYMESIARPFLEIPAYLTQLAVDGADSHDILVAAETAQQTQGIDVLRPLGYLAQWSSANIGGPTGHWAPFVNGAILFGLLPNISTLETLNETTRDRCDELMNDALAIIVDAIEEGISDASLGLDAASTEFKFIKFPSLVYSFFRQELNLRGVEWREPWHRAATLKDYVRIIRDMTESDDSAWASAVHVFAGLVGTQRSLPMEAVRLLPHMLVELTEDDTDVVKEVSYRISDQAADPRATRIIGDLLAFQAIHENEFDDKREEPFCPIKRHVGDKPASVRVDGANCQNCTGRFGSDVGLHESCSIARTVRGRLPGLFNGAFNQ